MKKFSLSDQPWYVHAAMFGAAALVLYAGFWFVVTRGVRAGATEKEAEVARLRAANAKAQAASQRISEVRAAYSRAQADYAELVSFLPEQRELTNVLAGLQDRTKGGLSVRRFTPKDDYLEEFYAAKPIEVEVSGAYNKLGDFFAQMAAYQRIVSISDFRIMQSPQQQAGSTVEGQFLLTAYYVSNEQLQKEKEEKERKEQEKKNKGKKADPKKAAKPEPAAAD
jgi:type IV pilus assembly protein PilO